MDKDLIILAIYINIGSLSRQQAEQQLGDLIHSYDNMYKDTNKDVKVYWFPVHSEQDTRVECIYPPPSVIHNDGVVENELLKIYKLLVNSKGEEAKEVIRDIERKLKFKKINDKLNET